MMKRLALFRALVSASLTIFLVGCCHVSNPQDAPSLWHALDGQSFQNVIMLIPDGSDETVQTVARWYKGRGLQVDQMLAGGVKTHMANSVITDSAAAATAFATGHKTTAGFLAVGPRTDDLLTGFQPTTAPFAPLASVMEAARLAGKATGVVATSRVTHATPAAFASHVADRDRENEIMQQMVHNKLDVVFGGGARHLIPTGDTHTTTFGDSWGGKRTDGEDLMQALLDRGYAFVDNKAAMQALEKGPVWGLFDDGHLDPDIDRGHFHPHQPSLAEMTAKAIELLSKDRDGFFLVVEGSQIDWAGHNNDPIYMTTEFLAFDAAVTVACDFADQNGRTLVMAFPDHNTGGMQIGRYASAVKYTATRIEDLLDPLRDMDITAGGLVKMLDDGTDAELVDKIRQYWNLEIDPAQVDEIRTLQDSVGLSYALARVISRHHTLIGWTTHGHTGESVPLWIHGSGKIRVGLIDNTDLARMAAAAMNVDLDQTTAALYVDLATVTDDYRITGDDMGNRTLEIQGAGLPVGKDQMRIQTDGDAFATVTLPGLTVYSPASRKIYISREVLHLLDLE